MAFNELAQALLAEREMMQSRNPWLMAGQALQQYQPWVEGEEYDKVGTPIASFLTGLGGSFANTYGQQQVDSEYNQLAQALAGGDSSGLQSSLARSLFETEKLSRERDLKDSKEKAFYNALGQNPHEAPAIHAAFGKEAPGGTAPVEVDNQIEARPLNAGPDFGVPSLEEVYRQTFAAHRKAGVPRVQAAAEASKAVEDARKRSRDLYGNRLADQAQTIADTEKIVMLGKEGIEKAGVTGSGLASMWEKGLAMASDILPGQPFPEAERQSAGDKNLELTRNLGAAINRIVGSGALSNMESQALFATAMSPTNARSQNEAILRNYQNGLAIMKEHQSFMNYFIDKTGSNPEAAQSLWELYKQDNPIVVQNQNGDFVVNEQRQPWQTYDFRTAYQQYMAGERSVAQAPQQMPRFGQQPQAQQGYSEQELSAAGYSPRDIQALRQKGLVR